MGPGAGVSAAHPDLTARASSELRDAVVGSLFLCSENLGYRQDCICKSAVVMVSTSAVVKLGPVQFSCPCTVPHEGRAEPPVPARSRRCSCACVATSAAVITCFNSFWILGLFPPSHQSLYMARLEFWGIVGGSVKWCGCRGNRGSSPKIENSDVISQFRSGRTHGRR